MNERQQARLGLRIDLQTTTPGVMAIDPRPDHRLRVHAGTPMGGTCGVERFVYTRGDVDLFPAGDSHSWLEEDPGTALMLQLSPSLLSRAAEDLGLNPDRIGLRSLFQFRDPQIEHIAWALDADRTAGYPSGLLYTEGLGMALAAHLLGRYGAPRERARGLSRPQLTRVTAFIEAHLDQDLSLSRLSEVATLSASHFKMLFRRSTGLPVHEYVVQRRVERAKTLLQRGDRPASQVALDAGFAHQSHMARCMRRVLGLTPTRLARAGASAR